MDCDGRWKCLLQLWSQTDALVTQLIAHTNGGLPNPPRYQLDGKEEEVMATYTRLSSQQHECDDRDCMKDDAQLLQIIERNLNKTLRRKIQEEETSQVEEEERTDEGYAE